MPCIALSVALRALPEPESGGGMSDPLKMGRLPSPSFHRTSSRSCNVSEAFPWNLIFLCLLIWCATHRPRSRFVLLIVLIVMACLVGNFVSGFR